MLNLFSGKPDHPLADAKELRRVLDELPAQDAAASLDSATAWLESLITTQEFRPERRLDILFQVDEAVLPQTRRLAREYLGSPHQTRAQEFKLWQINRGYWHQLVLAYEDTLRRVRQAEKGAEAIKTELPRLYVRTLNAYGQLIKWDQFRYGPMDGQFWASAGAVYLDAVRNKLADRKVALYGGIDVTPEAEYLKILVFQASSMDNLLPIEIEVAERLIAHLLPLFRLTDQVRPENVYWVDAAKPLPPTRLAKLPEVSPTLRFFATGTALEDLGKLRSVIETKGSLPAEVNFGGQYSPRVALPVFDHLAACWAPKPPMRHFRRMPVKSRMTVVNGLTEIRVYLSGAAGAREGGEGWVVEDVSQGGIGANVSLTGKEWLKVGMLVGMQPDGGDNWLVGVVRRLARHPDGMGSVGIETLSKTPEAVTGDAGGLLTEGVLLDPLAVGQEVRMAVPTSAWEDRVPVRVDRGGTRYRLFPQGVESSGAGHLVGRYQVELAG